MDAALYRAALVDARARLDLSLAVIPNVHQRQRRGMLAFFDRMVRDALEPVAPVDIRVVVPWHRQRSCWRLTTSRAIVESALSAYLGEVVRGPRGAATLQAWHELCGITDDAHLGAWLETSEHGMEAGFFRLGALPLARALEFMPDGRDRLAVAAWAEEHHVDAIRSMSRSAHPRNPWTEIALPLPGDEHLDQLLAARTLCRALDMPAPDSLAHAGILRAATERLVFVLGLSTRGPIRIGVAVHNPRPDALYVLGAFHDSDLDVIRAAAPDAALGMAELQHVLGVRRPPTTISWMRDATGLTREVSFALSPQVAVG